MREEFDALLADPVLARSPVQARLLEYLVEKTLHGEGKTLKSYSVAVEGLGRNAETDEVDTYARVQVVRLRKVLDAIYASTASHRRDRLAVDKGSYEVRLVPNRFSQALQPAATPSSRASSVLSSFRSGPRALAVGGIVCIAILAGVAIAYWRSQSKATLDRWRTSDFPFVAVSVGGNATTRRGDYELIRQSMILSLNKYEGIRVLTGKQAGQDYTVSLYADSSARPPTVNAFVIDEKSDRVVWSGSVPNTVGSVAPDGLTSGIAFFVSHPTGAIHSYERRRRYALDSPYGCWLAFTAQLQNSSNTLGAPALGDCSRDWYAAAPHHPLAAGLYGWAQIDKSASQISEAARQLTIRDAIETLERAERLSPNSAFLNVAAMRAYAFAGDGEAVRAAADRALKINPGNLDIQVMAGMMLAFWKDPKGEALLDAAIDRHFNPPAWYFVGKFTAAMARDDTTDAKQALDHLGSFQHSLAVHAVFSAALEARTGHLDRARRSWERAKAMQPVLRLNSDLYLQRLPVCPEIRSRLKQWLAPVLD